MSIAAYNDQTFDFDSVYQSMDEELTGAIQGMVDADQTFFR